MLGDRIYGINQVMPEILQFVAYFGKSCKDVISIEPLGDADLFNEFD